VKYLPRVLRYLGPYGHLAALCVAITIVLAGTALLAPWPLQILFDSVLSDHPLPGPLQPLLEPFADEPSRLLLVVVLGGFALTLLGNGLKVLNSWAETRLSQGMALRLRSDLFEHAQRLSLDYHDRHRSGRLIYAINFQANSAAGLVLAILPITQSVLTLVGMFWITYRLDAPLALLSLTIVPFLYYAVGNYISRIQPRLREVRNMEAESLSIIHEAVSMIRVILAFGREKHEHRRFRTQAEEAVAGRVGVTVRQTAFSLVVNTATAGGTALVLGFGVSRILQGHLTGGELLVVLAYVASIYKPLETITSTVGALQERFIALEMAFDLLDTEPRVRDAPGAVDVPRTRGEVVFEGVTFAYDGRGHALSDVSFIARSGDVIGIVGPTGAGKSTLVSLLPRFYDPRKGRILLDGRDIREIRLASLRSHISIVLQEPLLFSGTISENIRYGHLEAGEHDVQDAARAANAHDFIAALPSGYETRVGEKGVGLSGGERQRIAIARAFLKDAPILVLDEPTSSIDSRTEGVILDALDRLMVGRTTFMIAHRLSTIRGPDRVIVLDGGRIVEEGSIAELIGSGGLFSRLWEAQTGRDPHTRSGSDGRSTLGVTDRARTASAPAGHPP
jgi:ABC-type multidrug transport system fused ATPase/permease subunit